MSQQAIENANTSGQLQANSSAANPCSALMLVYLADKLEQPALGDAVETGDTRVYREFSENRIRPVEDGADMNTRELSPELSDRVSKTDSGD